MYNDIVKELEKMNIEETVLPAQPPQKDGDEVVQDLSLKDRLGAELGLVEEALAKASVDDVSHWRGVASKTVAQQVVLMHNLLPDTLIQAVKDCSIGMTQGGLDGTVAFHFDTKLAGEPVTHPNVRVCPLQEKEYCGIVSALLKARSPPTAQSPALRSGEIVMILDGGKAGNKRVLLKPWRPVSAPEENDMDFDDEGGEVQAASSFKTRSVIVSKTEASVRARRSRAVARGAGSIPQTETMHLCATDMSLPEMSWGHGYEGSNKGTAITGVVIDPLENDWTETVKAKKKFMVPIVMLSAPPCQIKGARSGWTATKSRCVSQRSPGPFTRHCSMVMWSRLCLTSPLGEANSPRHVCCRGVRGQRLPIWVCACQRST